MNNLKSFLIFIALVLLIYGSVNYYIFRRVVGAAQVGGGWGWALKLTMLLCIIAYPLGRSLFWAKPVAIPLTWIGGFWLAAMVYALLIAVTTDAMRLSDLFFGWLPNWITTDLVRAGRIVLAAGVGVVGVVLLVGRLLALSPVARTVEIPIERLPTEKDGYRVVLFADTHLGVLVGKKWFDRLVDQINGLNADLILVPGDILDENPDHVKWAVEPLSRLRASDGLIVTTGNHEFYAGAVKCIRLFERAGLTVLRDRSLLIPGVATIVGLDDITGSRQFNQPPIPVAKVAEGADPNLPLIVMHHTPLRIEEGRAAGADLFVSAHAHGGQLWPFDYVTRMVYGVKRGLTRVGGMNLFLTVGAGTWGPPIRIGATPEVVVLVLKAKAG